MYCTTTQVTLSWGGEATATSTNGSAREAFSRTSRNHGFDRTDKEVEGLLGSLCESLKDSTKGVGGWSVGVLEGKEVVVLGVPGDPWLYNSVALEWKEEDVVVLY